MDPVQNSSNQNSPSPQDLSDGTSQDFSSNPPADAKPQQSFNFSSLGLRFSTNNVGGKRIITSFLGMFLLLVGLGAGVVLVTQPQLLEQRAQSLQVNYDTVCNFKNCTLKSTTWLACGVGEQCLEKVSWQECPGSMSACNFSGYTNNDCWKDKCTFYNLNTYKKCTPSSKCIDKVTDLCKNNFDCLRITHDPGFKCVEPGNYSRGFYCSKFE